MAQIPYRANLSAAIYSTTIARSGPTVIDPQADNNFNIHIDPDRHSVSSIGIPQIMYCENVLPTPEGYQSVGYTDTGTITGSSSINTVETVRLAVSVESSNVTPDTDDLDEGDEMSPFSSWITSPNDTTGDDYRHIEQSGSFGNPLPSYHFEFDRNENIPAYFYQNYRIEETTNFSLSTDLYFADPITCTFGAVYTKFLTNSVGSNGFGVDIVRYHNTTPPIDIDYMRLVTGGGWNVSSGTVLTTTTITGFTQAIWYTLNITATKALDGTWTILISLIEKVSTTEVASIAYTATSTVGGYIGYVAETAVERNPATTDRFHTYIDNIHVIANAPEVTFTSVAGITNIDIAFFANNTANYSHGNVDTWENLTVELPGGFESPASSDKISITSVAGQCFVCIKNADLSTHIYKVTYNTTTTHLIFTEVTTTIFNSIGLAFNINTVLGIAGSYNYLILLTPDSVLWSSTTTLTDFSASLVSGAGNERVSNLKGDISFAKEHVAGLFLYTNNNIIFMMYTGNARYPWRFREVAGSSGFTYNTQVAGDTNSSIQYGMTNAKVIQVVGPEEAQIIAPEISNFIERTASWDTYDLTLDKFTAYSKNTFTQGTFLDPNGKYRVWFVLDKYVLVAYQYTTSSKAYNFLIVYDTVLKRYGKFKTPFHTILSSESSVYLINYDTRIKTKLILDTYYGTHNGVILLGKFQFVRSKFLTLDELVLENSNNSEIDPGKFNIRIFPTLDTKTFLPAVSPTKDISRSIGDINTYNARVSACNFSVLAKGTFDLVSLSMLFHLDGNR